MESLRRETIIWEGRYQPIHLGHIAYIRHLLSKGMPVWIYLVDNEVSDDLPEIKSPVREFTSIVDQHHRPEKNPLPFWLRYQLLTATLSGEFGANPDLTVWGGRRLDLHWPYVSKALPPKRKFILSKRDDFEDAKAKFWASLGQPVERIQKIDGPSFSATDFRTALANGEPIDQFLSSHTIHELDRIGIRDSFDEMVLKAISNG